MFSARIKSGENKRQARFLKMFSWLEFLINHRNYQLKVRKKCKARLRSYFSDCDEILQIVEEINSIVEIILQNGSFITNVQIFKRMMQLKNDALYGVNCIPSSTGIPNSSNTFFVRSCSARYFDSISLAIC